MRIHNFYLIVTCVAAIFSVVFGADESNGNCTGGPRKDWKEFNGRCYIVDFVPRYYELSRQYCAFHHSQMVSVHSDEENNFVKSLVPVSSMRDGDVDRAWLGTSAFSWSWLDGSPYDYHNFTEFIPHTRQCVITVSRGGDWNCTDVGRYWFRMHKIKTNDTEPPRTKLFGICSKNTTYTEVNGAEPMLTTVKPSAVNQSGTSGQFSMTNMLLLIFCVLITILVIALFLNRKYLINSYTSFRYGN